MQIRLNKKIFKIMKKAFLGLLFAIILSVSGYSQETITIGGTTPAEVYQYVPMYTYYTNSYSQTLYLASEIGTDGLITSMAYYLSEHSGSSSGKTVQIKIHMATTTATTISTSNYLQTSAMTLVYNGSLDLGTDTGWKEIELDTPFQLTSGDNLVIVAESTVGTYFSGPSWGVYSTSSKCGYSYEDYSVPTGIENMSSYSPAVQLSISPSGSYCYTVKNLKGFDIDANNATISWSEVEGSTGYQYQKKTSSQSWDDLTDNDITNTLDTSITLTNLTDNTYYNVRVRNVCSTDSYSSWKEISFKTACVSLTENDIPYTLNIENEQTGYGKLPSCWTRLNTTNTSYPYLNAVGLYMFLNNAVALNGYTGDITDLQLSFLANPGDIESYYGTVEVGIMTDLMDSNSYTSIKSIAATSLIDGWNKIVVPFTDYELSDNVETYYVVIKHTEPMEWGYGWTLKDITLEHKSSCLAATNVQVTDLTANTATITWTAGDETNDWTIYYCKDGDTDTLSLTNINDTTAELTNLAPETDYNFYIVTECGEYSPMTMTYSFKTACGVIEVTNDSAFAVDFSSDDVDLYCWDEGYWYKASTYLYTDNIADLILPTFDISGLTTPFLKINHQHSDSKLKVYYRTSEDAAWTEFFTFDKVSDTITDRIALPMASSTYGIKISTAGIGYAHIYSLSVYNEPNPPACNKAMDVQVNSTASSAVVTWSQNDDATAWILYYKTSDESSYTATDQLTDTTYTLSIEPQTTYSIYIATVCGNNPNNYPTTPTTTFTTPCVGLTESDLYKIWDFDSNNVVSETGYSTCPLPSCWQRLGNSTYPYVYGSSYNSHSGDSCLYFSETSSGVYAVLPFIDVTSISVNSLQLSFYAKKSSSYWYDQGNTIVTVGVLTDPTDKSTFVTIDSAILTNSYTYYEFPMASYQGQGAYPAIKVQGGYYSYAYIDDVKLEKMPDCIKPQGLAVSNITTSSATITWSQGGTVSTWNLYYKEEDADTYTEITDISTPSYTLTLSANKTYSVYVAAVCSDTILNTSAISFSTPCLPLTSADLPYQMNFENETEGVIPSCWTGIEIHSTNYGYTYPRVSYSTYQAYEGGLFFVMQYNTSVALKGYQGDISALQVSLWAEPENNISDYGTLEIGIQTNLSDTTTYQSVKVFNATDWDTTEYKKLIVPFDSLTTDPSATYYVILKHTESYNSGHLWNIDDVKLEVIPSCAEATNVKVTSVTGTTATLTWTQPDETTSWTLFYKTTEESTYQTAIVVSNETSYTLTGLTPQTDYKLYIQTNCSGNQPSTSPITFRTDCPDEGITITEENPYLEDFEGEDGDFPDCWLRLNTSSTDKTVIYVSGAQSGAGFLWIVASEDANQPMVIMPKFTNDLTELRLQFYSKAESDVESGDLELGYITDITDSSTFVVLTSFPKTEMTWTKHTVDLSEYADELADIENPRLAFRHNDYTLNSSWYYYALDSMAVKLIPACQEPTHVEVTTEATSATISWTSNAPSFNILVTDYDNDDAEIVNQTNYTTTQYDLTDLTPNTTYTVSITSVCADGSLTEATIMTFTTSCVALTEEDLPYETNFDNETPGNGKIPSCWVKVLTTDYYPCIYDASAYSGTNVLRMFYNNTVTLPPYEGDISALQLSMYVKPVGVYAYYGSIEVGIQTDLNDSTTYTKIGEMAATDWTTSTWKKKEFYFNNYQTSSSVSTYYVVIKHTEPNNDGNSWYLDDIKLGKIPACPQAKNIEVTNISTSSATIAWTQEGEGVTSWIIRYRDIDSENWQEETSVNMDTTITLSNLNSSTTYELVIEGECSDAEEGNPISDTITFSTTCSAITITNEDSYSQDFENGETEDVPLCWTKVIESSSSNLSGISGYTTYEGNRSLVMKSSEYCTQPMIALPEFTNPLSELRLKFYSHAESNFAGDLEIGYITDITDSNTFVVLTSIPNTEIDWTLHKIDLNAYDSILTNVTSARLAFRHNNPTLSSSWYYYAIDNLEIGLIPSCEEPTDVTITDITSTSATITWTSTANKFNLTISKGDQVVDSQTNLQAYTYLATNLTPSTTYKVSVKSVCDDGSITPATSATFTTDCGTIVLNNTTPWQADFTSSTGLNCWTLDPNSGWYISAGTLIHSYSNDIEPDDAVTSVFDLSNVTAPAVTLTYTLKDYANSNAVNTLTLLYRANSTDDWTELKSYNTLVTDAVDTIALPNKSATYQLNVRWSDYNDDADGIEVSALKIFNNSTDTTTPPTPTPCDKPTDLNVVPTANTLTLSWIGDATKYDVQINDEEILTIEQTSHTFTNLTPSTTYTLKVRSNCTETTSEWATIMGTTADTSSLISIDNSLNVLIYPNPTTSTATLEVKGLTEDANVVVTDVKGRIVLRMVYSTSASSITIPTENLESGVYYIKLTNTTMTKTQTLIKN